MKCMNKHFLLNKKGCPWCKDGQCTLPKYIEGLRQSCGAQEGFSDRHKKKPRTLFTWQQSKVKIE